MIKTDYLIVGQGIAGILTAFTLLQKGKEILVIDNEATHTASLNAAALLNPVNLNTGNTFPNQQQDFQNALKIYQQLESFLNTPILKQLQFYTFSNHTNNTNQHLKPCTKTQQNTLNQYFQNTPKPSQVTPVFQIHFNNLKSAWKNHLTAKNKWLNQTFQHSKSKIINHKLTYQNIQANKTIFCEGIAGNLNPYFPNQNFTNNTGNILHLKIDKLPNNYGFHINGKKLLPINNQIFWFGSNHIWNDNNPKPDPIWQNEQISNLKKYLKTPFQIINHLVAQRPTTAGQKHLLLQHPSLPHLYFLNGLGTRGFSKAPSLVKKLSEIITLE